jgi:hypothetical protein
MGEAPADLEYNNSAKIRIPDLFSPPKEKFEVTFLVPMQEPVARIGSWIELVDKSQIAIDPDEEHGAVDTMSFDVGRVMVGCSDPCPRFSDNQSLLFASCRCSVDNERLIQWPIQAHAASPNRALQRTFRAPYP